MQLRPYQQQAVEAVYRHLRERDDNPVVVLPTGSGKSWIIAQLAADAVTRWNGRVLVLAHVRELREQNADKIRKVCPQVRIGIYSAGLGSRDESASILVAGIQSVYKRASELGAFDLVIVDEAHLIPADGEGMYQQFLVDAKSISSHLRAVGLTATPFRLDSGPICLPDHFLNAICCEIGIKELIRDGYLCPLVSKAAVAKVDTSGLHVRAGEFVAAEVEQCMDQDAIVEAACREILALTKDRRSVLIFSAGVKHGLHVQRALRDLGAECGFVCGETPSRERDETLAWFRGDLTGELFGRKPLKYLANANLLTVGFDAPAVDCVVLLRPTMSSGLLAQICGRGFRLHPGKRDCLILDFAGNILRHGPIDQIQARDHSPSGSNSVPAKECPQCHLLIAAGYARCPDCGFEFPPPEHQQHDREATSAGVLSGQITDSEYEVRDITYSVHRKRDAPDDAPQSMRIDYRLGLNHWQSEFICLEHEGYARQKAVAWWRNRSPDPVPDTAERAVEIAEGGGLAATERITVRHVAGEKYDRIIGYKLGPMPEPLPVELLEFYEESPEDLPF